MKCPPVISRFFLALCLGVLAPYASASIMRTQLAYYDLAAHDHVLYTLQWREQANYLIFHLTKPNNAAFNIHAQAAFCINNQGARFASGYLRFLTPHAADDDPFAARFLDFAAERNLHAVIHTVDDTHQAMILEDNARIITLESAPSLLRQQRCPDAG